MHMNRTGVSGEVKEYVVREDSDLLVPPAGHQVPDRPGFPGYRNLDIGNNEGLRGFLSGQEILQTRRSCGSGTVLSLREIQSYHGIPGDDGRRPGGAGTLIRPARA